MFEHDGASHHAGTDSGDADGWAVLAGAIDAGECVAAELAGVVEQVAAGIAALDTAVSNGAGEQQRQAIARELSLTAARINHVAQRLHVASVDLAQRQHVNVHDRVPTMGYWLALHHGITRRDANRLLRANTAAERFEQVGAAFETGEITLGHLDAIATIIPSAYSGERLDAAIHAVRDIEAVLLDTASRCSLNQFENFCKRVRDRLDQDGPADPNTDPSRVTLSKTFRGRWRLHGDLTADDGALLATILQDLINRQLHTAPNETNQTNETNEPGPEPGPGEPEPAEPAEPERGPTMAQRRANALRDALLAAAGTTKPGRVGIYLHLDLDKLNRAHEGLAALFGERHGEPDVSGPAHTETNLDITDETLWALLANADVIPTFTRDGTPLSYGRTRRLAPDVLRRALAHRDRGCRFPGCERNTIGCDLHHLVHYSDGGTTDPNGLANVCPGHHHRHHNGDAVISGNPNQPLHATRPDGTTITNTPRYKQPPRP